MLAPKGLRAVPVLAAFALLMLPGASFGAATKSRAKDVAPWFQNNGLNSAPAVSSAKGRSSFSRQHGGDINHLPAVKENIDLVGKLRLSTPPQYRTAEHPEALAEGQIADLATYKEHAYLNSWALPVEADDTCKRGGFFSVDMSNPASPEQLAFIPALPDTYHGEGANVVTYNGRDILAVNNEACGPLGVGGFDLYDVTNPAAPITLVQGAGDKSTDEPADSGLGDTTQDPAEIANSAHSIFMWQDGEKLYAVIVDNTELHDVDIFDITVPAAPQFIADVDLVVLAEEQGFDLIDNSANGDSIFLHDMIVKKIDGVQTMLSSYWDSGYVKLNVNDPTQPTFIGDSAFPDVDPLTGFSPPEGNGHQSEFSHDNKFVLAADEDFSTARGLTEITNGPNDGQAFNSAEPTDAQNKIDDLPDGQLNGNTTFVGQACNPPTSPAVPPAPADDGDPNTEEIAVIERGLCTFAEKVQNAQDAGWDAFIVFNNANRPDGDPLLTNGVIAPATLVGAFVKRVDGLKIFNSTTTPAIGTPGADVITRTAFDGWGYTHLYRNNPGGNLDIVDDYAIPESLDERYASGFGDLSVHEFATDPDVNVAYSSYYAGGMRVFTFGDEGLTPTGKFIDEGGSNFWGVEQLTTPEGDRLFAGSDRDSGLYVFRYTGPGAYQKPVPTTPAAGGGGSPTATLSLTGCGNKITGTAARDLLAGSEGSDSIRGAGGDDAIDARKGDDCLFGDDGDDVVDGEAGNDYVEGAAGNDRLIGGTENDQLFGGAGVDRVNGEQGNDRISGGSGRDVLSGGSGVDTVYGSSGRDTITAGPGNDRVSGGSSSDRIYGGSGADRITPGSGTDRVIAGSGNDRISARDGKQDRISCGSGRDTISADRTDVLTGCERVSRR